jgi:hypothetical protein
MTSSGCPTPPSPPPAAIIPADRACIRCSYNLRGLPTSALCPECGTPVELSLRGHFLAFAAPEYLDALRRGLTLILNGMLLYIVALFGGLVINIALASTLGSPARGALSQILLLIPVVMMLFGHWLFTVPDPGTVDREAPAAARRVIRIAIAVEASALVFGVVADMAGVRGIAPVAVGPALTLVSTMAILASFAAWITRFFAVMIYLGWLGRRIPDRRIVSLTGVYMWLLPLITVLGLPLLFAGPILAVGLYWMLLDRLRKHLRAIRLTGMPALFA